MGTRLLWAIAVLLCGSGSTAIASDSRLIVTADRPFRCVVNNSHRDTLQKRHEFVFSPMPRDTYVPVTIVATDEHGSQATEKINLYEGTQPKPICMNFPAPTPVVMNPNPVYVHQPHHDPCDCEEPPAICTLCDFYWLILGLGLGWLLSWNLWKWLCYRMNNQQFRLSRQLADGGRAGIG